MANGLMGMFGRGFMPGPVRSPGGIMTEKRPQANGLLGIDPMTWLALSGALAQGAEQNSWGVGLGGAANVLQNRQLMQQQDQDRRADQGYRGWQMKQAERQAEQERRQAEILQRYREQQAAMDQSNADRDYALNARRTAIAERPDTAPQTDSFRPITPAERAAYGLEANSPYAFNERTGRPVPIGGTRAQEWTQDQSKVAGYANRMIASNQEIETLMGGDFNPADIRGPAGMRSQQGRQYDRAVREFASAVLRRETGATITQPELEDVQARFFPSFGDDAATIAAKAAARERIVNDYVLESSGAYQSRYGEYTPRATAERPSPTAPAPQAPPTVGAREDGYEYLGGDPANPASWRRVSQ